MAAQTITNAIAPRIELISPGGGSLVIKVYNTLGSLEWVMEMSTATVLAAFGAALSGASPALFNGGTGNLTYIPKNVLGGANPDGRLSSGGQLVPQVPVDVA